MAIFYPGASADDGEADSRYPQIVTNGSPIYIGRNTSQVGGLERFGYFRFPGIAIPRSAVITAATFNFYVGSIWYLGVVDTHVYMENSVNPAQISSYTDWQNRPLTGDVSLGTINTTGWFNANIASTVQSLVNNGAWNSGYAMQVHLRGAGAQNRGEIRVNSYDTGSGYAYLSITWNDPAPAAPSGFAGVAQDTNSILWTWNDVAYETGFRVLNESLVSVSGNLAANTLSWLETGLSAETSYTRRVQAYNVSGSANSSSATVQTMAALAAGYPQARLVI